MKRLGIFLLVVLALFVVADFVLRGLAENAAANMIDEEVTQGGEPDVDLGGFPFLPSLFAGRFDRIDIDISSASEGQLLVEDIHLTLREVELDAFELMGGKGALRADSLRGRATISEATINDVLAADEPDLRVEVEEERITMSRGSLSAPANAVVAANRILISAGEVLEPLEIPLPTFSRDVQFTSLRSEPGRLVLGVNAARVRIRS